MQFINEKNDLPVGLLDLAQNSLEPVFKFATELRAGKHRPQIERDDALVAQQIGYIARNNAPRQPLNNGCLAYAGLADQHRIVFRPAAQHLNNAANLLIASDHGIELASPRQLGQILGVFFKCLEFAFRDSDPLLVENRAPQ